MEGWVGLGTTTVSKQSAQDRNSVSCQEGQVPGNDLLCVEWDKLYLIYLH